MVGDGAFSKLCYKEILNLEGHPNCIAGSKVVAILLNGWILPIGEASSGRVRAQPAKQACFDTSHPTQNVGVKLVSVVHNCNCKIYPEYIANCYVDFAIKLRGLRPPHLQTGWDQVLRPILAYCKMKNTNLTRTILFMSSIL